MGVTIAEMGRRLQQFNITAEARDILAENTERILDLNKKQLYKGRDNEGNFLSPKYSEDPFFKTVEQARQYAQWKMRITPDPDRPEDVPNYFINGYYYSTLQARITDSTLDIVSNASFNSSIQSKSPKILGLNPDSIKIVRGSFLLPSLVKRLAAKTGMGTGVK